MSFYPEFKQDPSKPHQCVYYNEGVRCRSFAMHNQYTCYQHQNIDMPKVISNDDFPLEAPKDRDSIQNAIADVLVRLAANQMDIKRAGMLLYGLQIAAYNISSRTRVAEKAATMQTPQVECYAADRPVPQPLEDAATSRRDGI